MADRIKIITLMEQNMRQVDVANILHVNQSIVSRLWRKFQETQSIADRPREGRPRKTTPGQDRYGRLSARRNPIASATTLRHDLREATGVVVSSQTVRNRLHDIELYARRPLKTPALRPHHRGARARWARAHENWTRDQWTRTLFSDEVRMGLHPDNNSIRVWRRTGERNHPSMTVERHQQFGGSILFWAGVMFGRHTPLVSTEGNMTAALYENNILQSILVPKHNINNVSWFPMFKYHQQHNHDTCNTATLNRQKFSNQVKRKAVQHLYERPSKIIRLELMEKDDFQTLTNSDICTSKLKVKVIVHLLALARSELEKHQIETVLYGLCFFGGDCPECTNALACMFTLMSYPFHCDRDNSRSCSDTLISQRESPSFTTKQNNR
ncbi:hypothetical protein ANN_17888 [Periplaneta americana]|uniref:Transposase Tc1-like domain-containing protein n=1 Tax=Periplaneta americana TaxID=6978 RepID=A0ABQ8SUC5_PERAM|nr:hypothetical protein ANN_17888 [Periplaneta americana]